MFLVRSKILKVVVDNPESCCIIFGVFHFSADFRPSGPRTPHEMWTFQYRTPRSRPVIPSPCDFSCENVFLIQLSGNRPPPFFQVDKTVLIIVNNREV